MKPIIIDSKNRRKRIGQWILLLLVSVVSIAGVFMLYIWKEELFAEANFEYLLRRLAGFIILGGMLLLFMFWRHE